MLRYSNALLVDTKNYALVLRRSGSHPREAFHNDLPGGTLEEGESHEDGVVREVFEETGITISQKDLIEVYRGIHTFNTKEQTLFLVYLEGELPEVELSWEHDQFDWVLLDQLEQVPDSIDTKIGKVLMSEKFSAVLRR